MTISTVTKFRSSQPIIIHMVKTKTIFDTLCDDEEPDDGLSANWSYINCKNCLSYRIDNPVR